MEPSKLMTPLFYNGMFNRGGRRMRAVFEREVSNGTKTYRLWRSAGEPDLEYPRAENDKYVLYVEINGYLAPLRMTDFALTDHCGFVPAAVKLYGGEEKRGEWIDSLRESSGSDAVSAALAREREEIERYGRDPVCQADYIQSLLDGHVRRYLEAKKNGGQTFPDFIGALLMEELPNCAALSKVYKAQQEEKARINAARRAEEEKVFCAEQNAIAEQQVSAALQMIRDGGVLRNDRITFYRGRHDHSTYSIINHLMRLYHVDVPLRTQGWINDKLVSITIKDGKCEHLRYYRAKNGRGSQRVFQCLSDLVRAVVEQSPGQPEKKDAA